MSNLKYVNDKGYYSLTKLLKHNGDINIVCGEKGNGKSYAMKDYILKNYVNTGKRFVLLRRFDADIAQYKAAWYFTDYKNLEETFGYTKIIAVKHVFYFVECNEEGEEVSREEIGYFASVATFQQRFSSIPFVNIGTIFLEEFSPKNGRYLPNEIELFEIAVNTIARRNKGIKVFIVGNTFDRQSIYFRNYGIDIENQKQGSIVENIIRHTDGTNTKVVCEYCGTESNNTSNLIAINRKDILGGKWSVNEYKKLEDIDSFLIKYTFYIRLEDSLYECKYLVKGLNDCIYISQSNKEITNKDRLIDIIPDPCILHTTRLIPLSEGEKYIFNLLKIHKWFFSDNLTGTEFENRLGKIT